MDDVATGLATDDDGHIYIAGFTNGSLGGPHQGNYYNAWLVKYSAAGALRWKRQLGTSEGAIAYGVATDGDSNVYIAGRTGGGALVAKYSAASALLWVRQLEGATAYGVVTDGDSNVYIAGTTDGSLGGASQGYDDAWVANYSTAPLIAAPKHLTPAGRVPAPTTAETRHATACLTGFAQPSICTLWTCP